MTDIAAGPPTFMSSSQCDRHSQNIFVDDRGQIKLIDNEVALQDSWKDCGVDSILIPTTQKYNIVRMGMAVSRRVHEK